MKQITFYTDGACSGNPGEGGWAYVEVIPCDSGIKTNVVLGNKKQKICYKIKESIFH